MLVETFVRLLRLVEDETRRSPWLETPAKVKQVLANVKVEVPAAYQWKFGYLGLLLEKRQAAHYRGCQEEEGRVNGIIES
jgi:hypothetical protein